MEFYSLRVKLWDEEHPIKEPPFGYRCYPYANGKYLNHLNLFHSGKIYQNNFVSDDLCLDYFVLGDGDGNIDDWVLMDVHTVSRFTDARVSVKGFLASIKLKEIITSFKISEPFRFYPSKLMYQGKKIDYFLFQMARENLEGFNFKKSQLFEIDLINPTYKKQLDMPLDERQFLRQIITGGKRLKREKPNKRLLLEAVMENYCDIFYFTTTGIVVSELLKNEIEAQNITGLEFKKVVDTNFRFEKK